MLCFDFYFSLLLLCFIISISLLLLLFRLHNLSKLFKASKDKSIGLAVTMMWRKAVVAVEFVERAETRISTLSMERHEHLVMFFAAQAIKSHPNNCPCDTSDTIRALRIHKC